MDIGVSTSSLMRLDTEDAVKEIFSLGVKAVIDYATFYEYRPEYSKKLSASLGEVECISSRPDTFEGLLCDLSRRVRGDCLYWTDQLMRSAKLLNCKNYAFGGVKCECGFDELAGYLREDYFFCAHYGVNLVLRNKANGVYYKPNIFKEIKSRLPELYGVFDMNEAQKSGYPCGMYIEEMSGSIALARVNLSESLKEVIKRLKGAGFDGTVTLDVRGDTDIKQSLSDLKEIILSV